MKSLENRDFENAWKNAFADAEAEPKEHLWASISRQLSTGAAMHSRVVFYQRIAAAAALLAVLFGAITLFTWHDGSKEIAASKKVTEEKSVVTNKEDKSSLDATLKANAAGQNPDIAGNGSPANISKKKNMEKTVAASTPGFTNDSLATALATKLKTKAQQLVANSTREISTSHDVTLKNTFPLYSIKLKGKPDFGTITHELTVTEQPIVEKKETKKQEENWWAAVGGSAGAYLPQSSLTSAGISPSQSFSNSQSSGSNAPVGSSFSFGMTMGRKIAPRWVVLAGVNYLTQSIGYTSNQVANGSGAFLDVLSNQKAYATNATNSYKLNSTNEFVSIPLQVGFLIRQRKFGWQVNAGVASDVFLKNSLIDPSGKFSTTTESTGDNSVYQNINWTGLMGSEFSYKLSSHYRFSLVPGMRYSFQSIVKPSAGASINPLVWDVGFRLRYIFK